MDARKVRDDMKADAVPDGGRSAALIGAGDLLDQRNDGHEKLAAQLGGDEYADVGLPMFAFGSVSSPRCGRFIRVATRVRGCADSGIDDARGWAEETGRLCIIRLALPLLPEGARIGEPAAILACFNILYAGGWR